jgi:hypothetical protein
LNADQKTAAKDATDIILDILTVSTKMDVLDSFIEVIPDGKGLQKFIAGSRMIESAKVRPFLELLAKIDLKSELTPEKVVIGDIKFHELILRENVPVGLQLLLGKTPRFLVGTHSKDEGKTELVYVAAGDGIEEDLKRIIEETNSNKDKSGDEINVLSLKASMATFLNALDAELLDHGRKDENREVLVKAFNEKDGLMDGKLYFKNGQINGSLLIDEGFLRAVGKLVAEVSKSL